MKRLAGVERASNQNGNYVPISATAVLYRLHLEQRQPFAIVGTAARRHAHVGDNGVVALRLVLQLRFELLDLARHLADVKSAALSCRGEGGLRGR